MSVKYPLEDLLRVRKFREDAAANQLTHCRRAVEAAVRLVEERKRALKEYTEWRIQREAELYQEVLKQEVQLRALDDLKLKILELREREFAYQKQIHDAEQELQKAKAALEQAHRDYQEALRNTEKIDEHKGIWTEEMQKLIEELEEKELEDFHVRVLDDGESDGESDDA